MPMIRKLIKIGDSRAVTIPPKWLEFYRRKFGQDVVEVEMELNGEIKVTARRPEK
jgi:antitoxin component of MazEF toxin-antitoxin module